MFKKLGIALFVSLIGSLLLAPLEFYNAAGYLGGVFSFGLIFVLPGIAFYYAIKNAPEAKRKREEEWNKKTDSEKIQFQLQQIHTAIALIAIIIVLAILPHK